MAEQFFKGYSWMMFSDKYNSNEKIIYFYMADQYLGWKRAGKSFYEPQTSIAEKLHISKATVTRSIKTLTDNFLISTKKVKGFSQYHNNNVYTVYNDKGEVLCDEARKSMGPQDKGQRVVDYEAPQEEAENAYMPDMNEFEEAPF